MSVTGINLAVGAELLNLASQSAGQGAADPISSAVAAELKLAVAEVQISEAFLAGSDGNSAGDLLNVYA